MAGVERFELPDDGVRVRSLTAWRHPKIFKLIYYIKSFFVKQLFDGDLLKNIFHFLFYLNYRC